MPKQKDLKRLIRARMQKTGEAYTAARSHIVRKEPARDLDLAAAAGFSDAAVSKATGRTWAQWATVLDREGAAEKPHREIARYVSSLGTPPWWSQMVSVGYERIRGLREKGQRRGGAHEAGKSRTFPVSVARLFDAFANARRRREWLPVKVTVRASTPRKRIRYTWDDGTPVVLEFSAKGSAKSSVAVGHQRLADKTAAQAMKKIWGEHLDRLGEFLKSGAR
ncbi:MAG: SRPBCC domain-containing protein [Acidobacteriota bacterium]